MSSDEASSFSIVIQALTYAAEKHRHQRRKGSDHAPYVNHLIDVLDLLWRVGGERDPAVLAAGVLHDVVEDTGTPPAEIEARFGRRIRDLVMEVTDDKTLPQAERKRLQETHASMLSRDARVIKLADKISNVRDLHRYPPEGWPLERRNEYEAWARRVVDALRGANPALEAEFDRVLEEGHSAGV
jgi:guanosine-3',5'-bis(diphosphate) 3'-pyrophosphohydrolase